jgi:hypothetical protein
LWNLLPPKPCTKQWTTKTTNLSIEIIFGYNCPTLPEEYHLALHEVAPLQVPESVSTVELWVTGQKNALKRIVDETISDVIVEMTEIVEMIETVGTIVEMVEMMISVGIDVMIDEILDDEMSDEMIVEEISVILVMNKSDEMTVEEISVITAMIEMIVHETFHATIVIIAVTLLMMTEIAVIIVIIVVTLVLQIKKLTVSVRMVPVLLDVTEVAHVIEILLILIRETHHPEDIHLTQILMKLSKTDWMIEWVSRKNLLVQSMFYEF